MTTSNDTEYAYNPSNFGTDDFDSDVWNVQYELAITVIHARYASRFPFGPSDRDSFLVKFPDGTSVREQYRVLYEVNTIFEAYGLYELGVWGMCDGKDVFLGDEDDPLWS